MNLSFRLVLLCAVAVLPAVAIQLRSELSLRAARAAEIRAEAERVARYAASELERIVDGTRQMLTALGQAPSVVARDTERCSGFIEALQRGFPAYARLAVAAPDGSLLCVTGDVPAGFEVASLSYFQEAVASGRFTLGRFMVGRLSGRPVLPLALPLPGPDGALDRVAVAAIDLDWLSAQLELRGLPPGGSVTVADRDGVIVARAPEPGRFVGTRIPDAFQALLHAPQAGAQEVVSQDGTRRVLGYVPLDQAPVGLYVSAGLSAEAAFATIDRATRDSLLLVAAGLLSAVLAALVAGRLFLVPPVRRLLEAMRRWREGDTAARVGAISGGAELTRLAVGFDGMAETLAARDAALRAGEERLRLAQEAGGVGTFEVDLEARRMFASEGLLALHGLPKDAARSFDYDRWLSLIHPDDRGRVDAEVRNGLRGAGTYSDEFRILRADAGAPRWVQLRSGRRGGAEDRARLLGVVIDVTERREAEEALRAGEERLRLATEAAELGVWEVDLDADEVRWSPELLALFGLDADDAMTRERSLTLVHPDDRQVVTRAWAAAKRGGSFAAEFRGLRRRAGGVPEERWFLSRGRVLEGRRGRLMIGVNLDITERRRAEERLLLLAREVDHRAKNALAVVQATLRLTPRDEAASFARAVEGRVAALARAQTLLAADRWSGAELRALVEGELAPFLGAGQRVELDGPRVTLPPGVTQPLAMAVHELATNAVKHGALSAPDGRVAVTWRLEGEMLRLRWAERGGPVVPGPPARRGFGSRVLEGTVRGQLGGTVSVSWAETGLVCEMEVALRAVAEPV